jgi:ribose-phosphate pyrophosphokinase
MIIVPGPSSKELGEAVAEILKLKTVPLEFKQFPDGENYIRFTDDVAGEHAAIIQSTGPPQDVNLIQLMITANTAKSLQARSVTAVVPYLAYSRQDKRFRTGEAISIDAIIELLKASSIDRLITVNIHSQAILQRIRIPAENLSAIPLLAKHFQSLGLERPLSIAPDRGAADIAEEASEILGGGHGWLSKERDRITGEVKMKEQDLHVRGRDVVIFDDMISTGGTMAVAAALLTKQGARRVYTACVHALLVGEARDRILRSGAKDIVSTDSIPSPVSKVSVAPILAEALQRLL